MTIVEDEEMVGEGAKRVTEECSVGALMLRFSMRWLSVGLSNGRNRRQPSHLADPPPPAMDGSGSGLQSPFYRCHSYDVENRGTGVYGNVFVGWVEGENTGLCKKRIRCAAFVAFIGDLRMPLFDGLGILLVEDYNTKFLFWALRLVYSVRDWPTVSTGFTYHD